jgi:hypothetical protein
VNDVAASSAMVVVVVSKYARICSPRLNSTRRLLRSFCCQEVEVKDFALALCRFATMCGF